MDAFADDDVFLFVFDGLEPDGEFSDFALDGGDGACGRGDRSVWEGGLGGGEVDREREGSGVADVGKRDVPSS